jgi:hypothetical protein
MPSYFPAQLVPVTPTADAAPPPGVPINEVVIVAGSAPTAAASPTSPIAPPNKSRSNVATVLTETDLGFTVGLASSEPTSAKSLGSSPRPRELRFDEPASKRVNLQVIDIVAAANPSITQAGGLSTINPDFDTSANKALMAYGAQSVFMGSKPPISGQLSPAQSNLEEENRSDNGLISLIGKEPLYIASALISAGAVWWAARGLALATALMMGAPAWRQIDMLPVVLSPSHGFEGDRPEPSTDLETQLETMATTSFFNAQDGDLEEIAMGSLFEIPDGKPLP